MPGVTPVISLLNFFAKFHEALYLRSFLLLPGFCWWPPRGRMLSWDDRGLALSFAVLRGEEQERPGTWLGPWTQEKT